jgi:hypothetical protein
MLMIRRSGQHESGVDVELHWKHARTIHIEAWNSRIICSDIKIINTSQNSLTGSIQDRYTYLYYTFISGSLGIATLNSVHLVSQVYWKVKNSLSLIYDYEYLQATLPSLRRVWCLRSFY